MSGLVFVGDTPFLKMLTGEFFRVKLGRAFTTQPVSTMSTFKQCPALLPEDTCYLVVGCLPALLAEMRPSKSEKREVTLSKDILLFVFCFCSSIFLFACLFFRVLYDGVLQLSNCSLGLPPYSPCHCGVSDSAFCAFVLPLGPGAFKGLFSSVTFVVCCLLFHLFF